MGHDRGMQQIIQMAGALTILTAFVGAQTRRLETTSYTYMLLNLVGGVVLAVTAYLDRDWGFVLLETVWAAVSGVAAVGKLRAATA